MKKISRMLRLSKMMSSLLIVAAGALFLYEAIGRFVR